MSTAYNKRDQLRDTQHIKTRVSRRQARIRRNIIKCVVFASVFAAVVVGVLVMSSNAVKTRASDKEQGTKYYKSVTIKSGDSLWSLAETYMDESEYVDAREYVSELKKINNLERDDISAGQHIIVSYYSYE